MVISEDVNFLLLQYWEVVEVNDVCYLDGVSLHLDREKRDSFLNDKYLNRKENEIANSYDRFIGDPIVVTVSDNIFSKIEEYGTYKLEEYEFNNLVNIGEIELM